MVNQGLTRIPQMTLKSMRANDGDQRAAARTKGIEDPTLEKSDISMGDLPAAKLWRLARSSSGAE